MYLEGNSKCSEPPDLIEIGAGLLENYIAQGGNATFPAKLDDDSIQNFEVLSKDSIGDLCNKDLNNEQESNALKPLIVVKKSLAPNTSDRYVCPWRYTLNTDLNRAPEHIAEVACICDKCVFDTFHQKRHARRHLSTSTRHGSTFLTGKCQPVTVDVLVYRKQCNAHTGTFEYRIETDKIAVGCKCAYAT